MDRFSHHQEKAGEVYHLINDRFKKKRPEYITGEIVPAPIGEAIGSAKHIKDRGGNLLIPSLKKDFNAIKSWCQEENLFSERIGRVRTLFNKYKHQGVTYSQELRQEALTLAKEVLDYISEQSPNSLKQEGSLGTPDNVKDAINWVEIKWEKMSVNDLRSRFDTVKKWREKNGSLLRENLTEDEIEGIDNVASRLHPLFEECDNVYHTLSGDDQHIIAKNVLEYVERVEAPFYLADVWRVGKDKPMGTLTMDAIRQCTFIKNTRTTEQIVEDLRKRGLHVLINHGIYKGTRESLFVYDREALADLLRSKASILEEAGWPTDPDKFVYRVASETVPKKTKLFDVIADAFADYNNPGRMDIVASPEE